MFVILCLLHFAKNVDSMPTHIKVIIMKVTVLKYIWILCISNKDGNKLFSIKHLAIFQNLKMHGVPEFLALCIFKDGVTKVFGQAN